jgi:signal transduction histidine kinase
MSVRVAELLSTRPGAGLWARTEPLRRVVLDLLVIFAVFAGTVTQFGSRGFGQLHDVARDPDWFGFALVVIASAPLVWRRRYPIATLAVTSVASAALALVGYGVGLHVAPAVALYTLAARLVRPDLRLVSAVALAALVTIAIAENVHVGTNEDYFYTGLVWAAGWIVGDRRRAARQRVIDLQRDAERERRVAAAEERARIARELHDSAGHAINAILLQLGAARVLRDREPERSEAALETVERVARETIDEIDTLVGALREDRSTEVSGARGVDEIEALVEGHRASGLEVSLDVRGSLGRLSPAVDRAAYRIAQEALTNAARYGAGSAELRVDFLERALELTVRNAIQTGAVIRRGGGHGIAGMRERAALLGGTLEAGGTDGVFAVRAVLPYGGSR